MPDELIQVVDIFTLITLKQSGNYEQSSHGLDAIADRFKETQLNKYISHKNPINTIQLRNPMVTFPELETKTAQLQLEQQRDQIVTRFREWLTEVNAPNLVDEQKYFKQLP